MSQILDLLRPGDILTHCYLGRAQHRRRRHQHRPGRQAAAGGAGGEAARRDLRHRPRRRQLRLHDRRGGDRARLHARHDLVRHPRVLRQHAGHALPAVGDEQVPRAWASRWSRWSRWRRSTPARVIAALPKLGTLQIGAPADVVDPRGGGGAGRVRRHAQQQAHGQGAPEAGRRGRRRRRVRAALPVAVRAALQAAVDLRRRRRRVGHEARGSGRRGGSRSRST